MKAVFELGKISMRKISVLKIFMFAAVFIQFAAFAVCAAGGSRGDDGEECTLMGAAGYSAAGGGAMVLKNRDRNTRFIQSFSFEKPESGYAFFGIKNISRSPEDRYAYTMGINEKGLICVSSSAPRKINFDFKDGKFVVLHPGAILKNIATVDEFIEKILRGKKLRGSMNYIVADAKKLCLVEVVDRDHYDYRIVFNGAVCQTNHYYFDSMKKYQNLPVPGSTLQRLARAMKLAAGGARTFNIADFMTFSMDHGPAGVPSDLTICRHPDMRYDAKKFDGGTISSMVFVSKPGEMPCAYLALGQPCTANWRKFTIENGGLKTAPLDMGFLNDGTLNAIAEIKRDSWYHFINPFFYTNPLTKTKEVDHAAE